VVGSGSAQEGTRAGEAEVAAIRALWAGITDLEKKEKAANPPRPAPKPIRMFGCPPYRNRLVLKFTGRPYGP
jgi:hypothetical protein